MAVGGVPGDIPGEKPAQFGCERCWPLAADDAWQARAALIRAADLIDESHFHVMILGCPHCAQRFVSVFTETIDWEDGDDPQYWTLLPITEMESAELVQRGDSVSETMLQALGPGRRALRLDHPKAAALRIFWGTGISIRLHD
jgi:hypothetical protein